MTAVTEFFSLKTFYAISEGVISPPFLNRVLMTLNLMRLTS
jgi:hypothetical protein